MFTRQTNAHSNHLPTRAHVHANPRLPMPTPTRCPLAALLFTSCLGTCRLQLYDWEGQYARTMSSALTTMPILSDMTLATMLAASARRNEHTQVARVISHTWQHFQQLNMEGTNVHMRNGHIVLINRHNARYYHGFLRTLFSRT